MIIACAIILAALFAVLTWRDFKFALTVLFALLPTYLIRFSIGPLPTTLLEVFILELAIVWLIKKRQVTRVPYPLIALVLVATLSIAFAPDKLSALGLWRAYFIEPMMVFVMLRTTFDSANDWRRGLQALAVGAALVSVVALLQYLTGMGIPVPWDIEKRVTGVFEYPNALGLFVAPIVAALIVARPRAWWLTTALGAIAIVLAKTEAAFVAIPAALVAGFALMKPQWRTALVALGALGVAACFVLPMAREKVLLQDTSGLVRRAQWSETAEFLKEHPLQGAGLAGYPTAIAPYHDGTLYEIFQYPHNIVLNIWVELGLLGVIVAVWLAAVVIRHTWRNRHDPLIVAGFVALLTMAIHGLVDVPFFKNDLAVLTVFFLAMTLSTHDLRSTKL